MSTQTFSLKLPDTMNPGAIIGTKGSNIKRIQQRTGARLNLNDNVVKISGAKAQVDAAVAMVENQVAAYLRSGGAYPHPTEVHYLLSREFQQASSISFALRCDEVARGTERTETLWCLQPEARPDAALRGVMQTALLFDSYSQGASKGQTVFHAAGEQSALVDMMGEAMMPAVSHNPKFDMLKLRFNLGKAFFYNGAGPAAMSLDELKTKRVGAKDDFKSVFSNVVTAGDVQRLKAVLLRQRFQLVEEKHKLTVHFKHGATQGAYDVGFSRDPTSSALSICKIRSAGNKLFFLSCNNPLSEPDCRIKLLAHYQFQDCAERRMVEDACRGCSLTAGFRFVAPGAGAADLMVDRARVKDKHVYESSVQDGATDGACTMKVTFSKVTNEQGQTHYQVTGCCAELNDSLLQLIQCGGSDGRRLGELRSSACTYIHSLLAFTNSLRPSAA